MAYSYDPAKIKDWTVDRMRFELGDTQIAGGADTCALSDEEYAAMIETEGRRDAPGWRRAKIKCLQAIVARFAMMVDFNASGVTIALSERYERWKSLLMVEEGRQQVLSATLGTASADGGHYFWFGQQDNCRAQHPPFPYGG